MLLLRCHILYSVHLFHVLLLDFAGQICIIFSALHRDFCVEATGLRSESLFRPEVLDLLKATDPKYDQPHARNPHP